MPKQERKSTVNEILMRDAPHRIFFIRHGETDWNREFRYQGSSDVELNSDGREQARRAGLRLSRIMPERVCASPLKRARQTAGIIMENNRGSGAAKENGIEKLEDITIELWDDLREISFGLWEGLTMSEINERDAETLSAWRKSPFSVVPSGGEPFSEVAARAGRAAARIKDAGRPGSSTFVVSHGAVLRALLAAFMDAADADLFWRIRLDNCSISALDMWGRRPSLLFANDTHHTRLADGEIALLSFPE